MTIITPIPDAIHKVEPSWNGDSVVGSRGVVRLTVVGKKANFLSRENYSRPPSEIGLRRR